MVSVPLPQGRFKYGPRAAVLLDVTYVESQQPTLVPVRDPFDAYLGRTDELQLSAATVTKLATRTGVTPDVAANFSIAYFAAKVAVGRAMPAYSADLLDAPTLWEQVNGDVSAEDLASRKRLRDLLAVEMAGALARRHPQPVERFGLESVRYGMLCAAGFEMDSPLQRDVHSRISGDIGDAVSRTIRDRILPWFRANIAG